MADQKLIIKSVQEATCENCIYSSTNPDRLWCHHIEFNETISRNFFCNLGRWLANDTDDKMIFAHALNDIYYIFQGGAYE